MSKNRWALVCTVGNNLGENFPHQQVLTFGNEKEAIWYAANLLREHDESVDEVRDGIYRYKGQHWTAAQFIVEWRETNLDTELFHIWEVVEVSTGDVVDALIDSIGQGCCGCGGKLGEDGGCQTCILKDSVRELIYAIGRMGDFHEGSRVSNAIEKVNDFLRGAK